MQHQNPQIPTQGIDISMDITTWALPECAIARLGQGDVSALAFSPDKKYLVVGTWIGVWWYELLTMSPIAVWETERGVISTLDFSPNGKWLVTGNLDGTIKVWNIQRGICRTRIEWPPQRYANGWIEIGISQITFSGDNQHIASSRLRNGVVCIWDAETGTQIAELSAEQEMTPEKDRQTPRPLCFSPDGQLIACASPADTENTTDFISVWHVATSEYIACFKIPNTLVYALTFSPCGQFLACGSLSGTLWEWNIATGKLVRASSESTEKNYKVIPSYSLSGELFAAWDDQSTINVSDVERSKKLHVFEHLGNIRPTCFCFSNGTYLATAGQLDFKVWSVDNPQSVASISGHTHATHSLTFSPDGRTLACVCGGPATVWDVAKKRPRQTVTRSKTEILSVYISSTRNIRALGTSENTTIVWDVETDKTIANSTEHEKKVNAVAFAPTGEHWASADIDGNLYVRNSQGKQTTLAGHKYSIQDVAFSPDGQQLVSASKAVRSPLEPDATARVWDVESGTLIASLPSTPFLEDDLCTGDESQIQRWRNFLARGLAEPRPKTVNAIAFSPCGSMIAGSMPQEIRLWDATTYETCLAIFPPRGCNYPHALAFSPNGQYLASGSWFHGTDKVSIRLWEVTTGKNIVTFWGHPTDIQDLAFSPDGALLASGGYDGTILLWDMKPFIGS